MNKKHGAWSKNEKIFLGLLAPILVLFFCFNTLPLIKGFYYGLTNFRGYGSYDFVGLRNFAEIFQDSRVGHSYLFTFKYEQQDPWKKCTQRNLFCTKYSGRSGYRLYLQFHFYIYSANDRRSNRN